MTEIVCLVIFAVAHLCVTNLTFFPADIGGDGLWAFLHRNVAKSVKQILKFSVYISLLKTARE